MIDFTCIFFFLGCNKEANHKIRFPPLFIYLFIFPVIFFICKFGFIIKQNVKGALRCQNGLVFGSVVSQTVLYLPVKFRGNPSFCVAVGGRFGARIQ